MLLSWRESFTRGRFVLHGSSVGSAILAVLITATWCPAAGASSGGGSPVRTPTQRALVVGIDDYTASRLPSPSRSTGPAPGRAWGNLSGAVNDAEAIGEVLTDRYGYSTKNVRILLDQEATRDSILAGIEEHLVASAGPGDRLVFFYAGHGSRVVDTKSTEPDHQDESLVPADSRLGAPDIRDKELRRLFNRALDRGARLTVILDTCHSGSGARGVPNARSIRGVRSDPRDVADGAEVGPPLENRSAVILSAAQDFGQALESWDEEHHQWHGAFTLALLRAIRATGSEESVEAVFRRARAWLHGPEGARQEPVLAGRAEALALPFLGQEDSAERGRLVAAVETEEGSGRVVLEAGWIDGLGVGSELESLPDGSGEILRLRVTALDGLTHSRAEVVRGITGARRTGAPASVRPGELFTQTGWTVAPGPPLRVWAPAAGLVVRRWAEAVLVAAATAGVALSADPTSGIPPTHVLSWRRDSWCLAGADGTVEVLDQEPNKVIERLRRSAPSPRLFIEPPAPPELVAEIRTALQGSKVELVDDPAKADYSLVGRRHRDGLELAWVLPGTTSKDSNRSPLPLRSRWHRLDPSSPRNHQPVATDLVTDAASLGRVLAWVRLAEESPTADEFPYRLALRPAAASREATVTAGRLVAGDLYGLLLRRRPDVSVSWIAPRWVYVFVVDSFGQCRLLYPRAGYGTVENRFPLRDELPIPSTIQLGSQPGFSISAPFGVDNYYLLTTEEPIPNPGVLECPGVRGPPPADQTALGELLVATGSTVRGAETRVTPRTWSLERLVFQAVPARPRPKRTVPSTPAPRLAPPHARFPVSRFPLSPETRARVSWKGKPEDG